MGGRRAGDEGVWEKGWEWRLLSKRRFSSGKFRALKSLAAGCKTIDRANGTSQSKNGG
jgi:hypothetical protein